MLEKERWDVEGVGSMGWRQPGGNVPVGDGTQR